MEHSELKELHYITYINNVPSILKLGILNFENAKKIESKSFAMNVIQEKREKIVVPNGLPLHKYANLYIHARNVTLYSRRGEHKSLCVLQVSTEVLDISSVVIADGNASSDYTAFYPSPSGIKMLDRELVFAEFWTDDDPIEKWRKRRARCAEVLVPERIPPKYIVGAYVSNKETSETFKNLGISLPIVEDPHLFFL
ncbi:MAG: DUF4433 domain-containing protein [Anaerolineales bacterium]